MELEGLRGIAAVIVALYHFSLAFYLVAFFGIGSTAPVQHIRIEDNLYANPIMGLLSGTFAVAIFFVLSGFVLSIGFFQTGRLDIVKKLAAKRYLRLMLPAFASILICYLLITFGLSHTGAAGAITGSTWLANSWQFVPNFFDMIQHSVFGIFVDGRSFYNNVLWTMTTEFLGSFLVFGVLLLFAQSKYRWIVYGVLVYATFNTWFLGFIIGMILADLYARGTIVQQARNLLFIVPLLLFSIYLGGYPHGSDVQGTAYAIFPMLLGGTGSYQTLSMTLGATIIVFSLLWTSQFAGFMRKKYISSLGKYTFALYLVHIPILYTFTTGVFVWLHGFLGYNKAVLASFVLSVPVVWAATLLFEKYVDRNAIRFSSYCAAIYFGERQLLLKQKLNKARALAATKLRSRPIAYLRNEPEAE